MDKVVITQNFIQTTFAATAGCLISQLAGREIASLGTLIANGVTPVSGTVIAIAPVIAAIVITQLAADLQVPNKYHLPLTALGVTITIVGMTLLTQAPITTILAISAISLVTSHLTKQVLQPMLGMQSLKFRNSCANFRTRNDLQSDHQIIIS